ncbi:tetratricopeptide repeat protein [Chondromyces crocatus]|uniref:Uncharacterized protein n=1 Tax=Chondromyces crocatus TaxID=52 RepID=A0A0K1EQ29_CHOCO|nr:tetratricopeptide repeat protein [Chondromyces crocatus]AKT42924.1 uncharacterized protein CMC5_071520 [Chondromyces crocatus]
MRPRSAAHLITSLLALLVVASPRAALAQTSSRADVQLSPAERLEQAKILFRRGNALLTAGDEQGALEHFLRSRELVPSYQNTRNAASCLDNLGRPDEALDMYESLLDGFGDQLGDADRDQLTARMRELLARTARVFIIANVEGTVFVDDRPRGTLPLKRFLRLSAGWRNIRVSQRGYRSFTTTADVQPNVDMLIEASLGPLEQETSLPHRDPREPAHAMPGWFLQAHGGYVVGPSLGSNAEVAVQRTCAGVACPGAAGVHLGLRLGYLTSFGLGIEISAGYLDLSSTFQRTIAIPRPKQPASVLATYTLDHELLLRGSYAGAGLSYRLPIGWRLSGLGRMTAMLASAQSADRVSGIGRSANLDEEAPLVVEDRDQVLRSAPVLLSPEIGVEAAWGRLRLALSIAALILPSQGPRFSGRRVGVDATCPGPGVNSVERLACMPDSNALSREPAYGAFLLWTPQLAVAATF